MTSHMAEAIKILESTTSGAVGQTYSLLQLSSHADLARTEVLTLVKKLARQQHSAALAQASNFLLLALYISVTLPHSCAVQVCQTNDGFVSNAFSGMSRGFWIQTTELKSLVLIG